MKNDLATLAAWLHLEALAVSSGRALLILGALFLFIYFCERIGGADRTRYLSRNFRNDVLYGLFYRGGFYNVLIGAALANALGPHLSFLRVGLLVRLPLPLAAVIAWFATDFLGYWIHRLQHKSRLLWAFHSVHHAQERMTFLTSYRIHPIEQVIASVIMFAPLLVLGIPTQVWLPLYVVQSVLEAAQHAELDWRYGPCYPLLVSPVFHAFHHSTSPDHYNRNFGKVLSVWDFLFGTAVRERQRPSRYGVEGLTIPESIGQQLVAPFRLLYRQFSRRPAPVPDALGRGPS